MIVVDTNVIAFSLIQGDKTKWAQQVRKFDSDWIVPGLWRSEFLNVLATLGKNRILTTEQCLQLWATAETLFSPKERAVDMKDSLVLALKEGITAYDAQYVTLACSLKVRCVTEDRRLLRRFPATTISMRDFCTTRHS